VAAELATWLNLLRVVSSAYPEWRVKIDKSKDILAHHSYEQIRAIGGIPLEVRQFLEQTINVNALFAGDGYIRHESGEKLAAEYIALNKPLSQFTEYCLIDFPVE
jgi:hypothetical protein